MSRVPLLYFSRGQLELFGWSDPVADWAARISQGEVKSAAVSIRQDRKSTRLNSSHSQISYAVFCLKTKNKAHHRDRRSISPAAYPPSDAASRRHPDLA